MTLVLFEEERNEGVDTVDDASDVDVQDPIPHGLGGPNRHAAAHPGVVEHDVRRAELVERRVTHRDDVGLLSDVTLHADHARAVGAQGRNRFLEWLFFDVAEHEFRARGRKPSRGGETNATRPARDDRSLAP